MSAPNSLSIRGNRFPLEILALNPSFTVPQDSPIKAAIRSIKNLKEHPLLEDIAEIRTVASKTFEILRAGEYRPENPDYEWEVTYRGEPLLLKSKNKREASINIQRLEREVSSSRNRRQGSHFEQPGPASRRNRVPRRERDESKYALDSDQDSPPSSYRQHRGHSASHRSGHHSRLRRLSEIQQDTVSQFERLQRCYESELARMQQDADRRFADLQYSFADPSESDASGSDSEDRSPRPVRRRPLNHQYDSARPQHRQVPPRSAPRPEIPIFGDDDLGGVQCAVL